MRQTLCILAGMLLPLIAASAPPPEPSNEWHRCDSNADCVVVPGICGNAAVNVHYKNAAAAHYKEQSTRASCPQEFWKFQSLTPRCYLQNCQMAVETQK